jgi:regulator of sirC expression with transglutaminase-like and TPR domain
LFPDANSEVRDRGLLNYQLGNYAEATADLQNYLTKTPNTEDAALIRRLLSDLDS